MKTLYKRTTEQTQTKLIVLAVFCLCSLSSYATHLMGGELYWECNGSGQYIFHMDLYRECASGSASLGTAQTISGPQGNITLSLISTTDLSPSCSGGGAVSCGMPAFYKGAVEFYKYQSVPISFTGVPPTQGWNFTWSSCCRSTGTSNLLNPGSGAFNLTSKMYQGFGGCNNSPRFTSNAQLWLAKYNSSITNQAHTGNPADSLHYRLVTPMISSSAPVTFLPGYSATQPFPNPATDSSNSPVSLDHTTGLISFGIQENITGLLNYAMVVEQWRGGKLLSEVIRDVAAVFDPLTVQNTSPTVLIDSTNFNKLNLPLIEVFAGDTVYFEMVAVDNDFNIGTSTFQNIRFNASGFALAGSHGGLSNYQNKAIISPVAPQAGFVSTLRNEVAFQWVTAVEHLNGSSGKHDFTFNFSDDHCRFNGVTNFHITVKIKAKASVVQDSVNVCQGDSIEINGVTKSGNYSWYPATGLSSTTDASPLASPTTSQYYYLSDPADPSFKDSVYVSVTPKGTFGLGWSMGQLSMAGSAQPSSFTWFYNGVPFYYPYDTLTPFGLGVYYVIAKEGPCKYYSDTVVISSGMSLSNTAPGNGTYSGSPSVLIGSWGVTFEVDQNINVHSLSIPGLKDLFAKTGGYDLGLELYGSGQQLLMSKYIGLTRPIDELFSTPFNVSLQANQEYTLVVTGDTAYAFSFLDGISYPAQPHNVGMTIKALLVDSAGSFPTIQTGLGLPISLGIDRTVSLMETGGGDWMVYPNPASGRLTIENNDGKQASLELIDVRGVVVRQFSIEAYEKIHVRVNALSEGMYFLKGEGILRKVVITTP